MGSPAVATSTAQQHYDAAKKLGVSDAAITEYRAAISADPAIAQHTRDIQARVAQPTPFAVSDEYARRSGNNIGRITFYRGQQMLTNVLDLAKRGEPIRSNTPAFVQAYNDLNTAVGGFTIALTGKDGKEIVDPEVNLLRAGAEISLAQLQTIAPVVEGTRIAMHDGIPQMVTPALRSLANVRNDLAQARKGGVSGAEITRLARLEPQMRVAALWPAYVGAMMAMSPATNGNPMVDEHGTPIRGADFNAVIAMGAYSRAARAALGFNGTPAGRGQNTAEALRGQGVKAPDWAAMWRSGMWAEIAALARDPNACADVRAAAEKAWNGTEQTAQTIAPGLPAIPSPFVAARSTNGACGSLGADQGKVK